MMDLLLKDVCERIDANCNAISPIANEIQGNSHCVRLAGELARRCRQAASKLAG
jgi:hypothetical protein